MAGFVTAIALAVAQQSLSVAPVPAAALERRAVEQAVFAYNDALVAGDVARFRETLAGQVFMFNGSHSADPTKWEAHLYVSPDRLERWTENYVKGAGPHVNAQRLLSVNVRGNAAMVTTEDTGRNRFRSWTNEHVTWMLGKQPAGWKVVGFFIRDIRNPG